MPVEIKSGGIDDKINCHHFYLSDLAPVKEIFVERSNRSKRSHKLSKTHLKKSASRGNWINPATHDVDAGRGVLMRHV